MSNEFQNKRGGYERDYELTVVVGEKGMGKSTCLRILGDRYYEQNPDRRVLIHDAAKSRAFTGATGWHDITMDEMIDGIPIEGIDSHTNVWRKGKRRIFTLTDPNYETKHEKRERARKVKEYQEAGLKMPPSLRKGVKSKVQLTAYNIFENFRNGLVMMDEAYKWASLNAPQWSLDLVLEHRNKGLDVVLVYHTFKLIPYVFRANITRFIIFKTADAKIRDEKWFWDKDFKKGDLMYQAFKKVQEAPYHQDLIMQPFEVVDLTYR